MNNKETRRILEVLLLAISIYSLVNISWHLLSFLVAGLIDYEFLPFMRTPLFLLGVGYFFVKAIRKRNLNLIYLGFITSILFVTSQYAGLWGYHPSFCGTAYITGEVDDLLKSYYNNIQTVGYIQNGLIVIILLMLSIKYKNENS